MKRFSLSVTEFALPSPLIGSIDIYSGYSEGKEAGVLLHQEIQARRKNEHPSYQSEVFIKHDFKYKNYIFAVKGRADGIYRDNHLIIEEIKSSFNLHKIHEYIKTRMETHPFCLQLLTYGYIHWLKSNELPTLNLHLVSSRNKQSIDLTFALDINKYELWLQKRLSDLAKQAQEELKRIERRKKVADNFQFPFQDLREGQTELVETIQNGFEKKQPMLIQAPTGLGKTIGVLYPALREALQRGQKTIYLTPKNSQHLATQKAVKNIQEKNSISSMTLTAKSKVCFKTQAICNSEFCEYAKDYYTKLTKQKILSKLKKIKNLNASHFKKIGLKYQICPYELQMDYIANVDVIIGDYNYVFSPQNTANRLGKIFLGGKQKPNLIIDEFHNLPQRGMGYYSPTISVSTLQNWISSIESIEAKFQKKLHELLLECINAIRQAGASHPTTAHVIKNPIKYFNEIEKKLREFVAVYLEANIEIKQNDIILNFLNYWTEFNATLEYIAEDSEEFFISYIPKNTSLKITCCDAASLLEKCYSYYAQVIGFSATLKPFNFYSELSGIPKKKLKTFEIPSPFPQSQRKLLIIPQISSKFSTRERNYPRIVEAIQRISNQKKGNYFVFLPSFDFLENILKIFPQSENYKIIAQKRNMNFQDVKNILQQLKDPNTHHLIFAIQGGILAEGVDYPGNMIIGAMIVGVPLPMYDWEREQIKAYYEKKYQSGVEYAYIFTAMSKAIQASGRVIRSDQDVGIIILMDQRFLEESYFKCAPSDWFTETPKELISNSILKDIREFWEMNKKEGE